MAPTQQEKSVAEMLAEETGRPEEEFEYDGTTPHPDELDRESADGDC